MKANSVLLIICLILATGCLGTGYLLAGYWQILPVLLVIILIWIVTKKRSPFWSASSFLLVYMILAAVGIAAELSPLLMIIAGTASLVSWDMMQFNRSMVGDSLQKPNTSLEKYHLGSLALAVFTGLALALISLFIDLQLPFVVIVLLVLIAVGFLINSMLYVMKKKL